MVTLFSSRYYRSHSRKMRLFMLVVMLGTMSARCLAQPVTSFVPPNFSDNVLAGGVTDIHMVNCDMLDIGAYFNNSTGSDKLWAIAYGNEKGSLSMPLTSGLYVGVENGTSSYTPLGIPFPYNGLPTSPMEAFDPDVVVGNWNDANGTHYFVAAVYQDAYDDIYMDAYELDFSSYPAITTTIIVVNKLLGSSGWHPHIDLCADPSGYAGGAYTPTMHRFAVAWTGGYQVWVASDDMATFNSSTTVTPDLVIHNHGLWSDIACVTDPILGKEMVYLVYNDGWGPQTNYITEWDLNMKMTGTTYSSTLSSYFFQHPRIDAATLYDYQDSDAGTLFHAVDYAQRPHASGNGNTTYDIWHATYGEYGSTCGGGMFSAYFDDFNPLGAIASCIPCPSSILWENIDPAVCGTGNFLGGGELPGRDNFSYGFYGYGTHDIGGSIVPHDDYFISASGNDYCPGGGGTAPGQVVYAVNNTALYTSFNAGSWTVFGCAMGVATCTNSGYDIMGAWYTGDPAVYAGEIRYKFGSTSYAFRQLPAVVNNIDTRTIRAYPNPVKGGYLNIDGNISPRSLVTIEDILGRKVFEGQINGRQLDVSTVDNGIYVLKIQNGPEVAHTEKIIISR